MHPAKRLPLWTRVLSLFTALCVPLVTAPVLPAAVVYLDANGTTAGSGITNGSTIVWDTSALWNSSSLGTGTVAAWVAGDVAAFSAGVDAGAAYTVQISGSQTVGGLAFEEGAVTLSGGTLVLSGNADVSVATGLTATISSAIDDGVSDFNLTKLGGGTLDLQASSGTVSGVLRVDGGTLRLGGAGALTGLSGVTLSNRANLTLDNTATNSGDRLAGAITSSGGTINFTANAAATTETLGALTLNAGALTVNSTAGAGGSILTVPSVTRNAGGTLYLNGTGLGTATNQVVLSTAPALVNSVLRYAVVNNGTLTSFATYSTSAGTDQSVAPLALASHNQGAETTWVAANNVRPTADVTVTTARSLYTLTLDSGIDLLGPAGDRTINVGGAVLQTGGVSVVAANSTNEHVLAFGANEALFIVLGSLQLDRGNTNSLTGTGGFTKSGAGTLILNGVSTLTGAFNVNEGVLEMRGGTSLMTTAAPINLNGANLRLSNDASTTYTGQIVVNADSTITVDRVNAAATATTHTLSTLTIASGRMLSVNSNDITANTAYGLTFSGALTLAGPATLDVANNGTGLGTLTVSTVSGAFPLTKTGAGDLVLSNVAGVYTGVVDIQGGRVGWSPGSGTLTESSVFSGAGGIVKAGNGAVNLTGANTFTGGVTVNAGTLGFSTVSDNGGPASNLGMGTNAITLGTGTLSFIGSTSQSTNRAITTTGSAFLNASGTGGATITYTGAITPGVDFALTLTGTGAGIITGGITMPVGAGSADLNINSGTWTFSGTPIHSADDIILTGSTVVVNLNSAGILTGTGTTNGLYIRSDAVVNLGTNDVTGVANSGGNDLFVVGDTGVGTLNTNGFSATLTRLDLGDDDNLVDTGSVTGSGLLTVSDFNFYRGSIAANLAGTGTIEKFGLGTVTLSGDNSGLGTAAAGTRIDGGSLVLDYTTSNTSKISTTNSIDIRGGTLTINGNATADTTQTVVGLTLANFGSSTIAVNSGAADKAATLALNAITRATGAGTIRFNLSGLGAVTTTTANLASGILGGWATIRDVSGEVNFAANNGSGGIVAIAPTTRNDVGAWVSAEHITDGGTGFTGNLAGSTSINSLRFNAAGPSTITLGEGMVLGIASGGVLQTSNVTGGTSLITGGRLVSGTGSELIFNTDSTSQMVNVVSAIGGGHAVTKGGNGTLRLSGTNNYTSTTRLLSGMLQLSGGNAVGDTSALVLGATQANILELLNSEAVGSFSGGTNANLVTSELRLNGNTLSITQTTSGTFSGLLTGTAASAFVKTGAANLQFTTSANPDFLGTVTVNGGLFYLTSSTTLLGVPSITLNKGASFLFDNNGTTTSSDRIANAATLTLNSADGAWSGETRPSGLSMRRDQGSGLSETIGVLTLNSGASYTRLEGTATNSVPTLIVDNIVRANKATLDVRGTNMSATTGARAQLRIGTAGNQTTFINAMVGGGSTTLGTKNISIVPWAIGEEMTGGLGDTNMGNSLMTYVSGTSFRALNLTTEYNTFATKATNQDNIREVRTADLTGLTGQTINGLVLHNNSTVASIIEVFGTGAGQTLGVTSGAMLFTLNTAATASTAHTTVLGGFDTGITVGGTNEYVIHVVNPSSVATTATLTAAISSPLSSAADITKSGRGTLILTSTNTAGGGVGRVTTINEGVLQISDLDNIGGDTGALVFAGGTLRLAVAGSIAGTVPVAIAAYSGDDLSTRTLSFLNGGGTLDTNGFDLTLANGLGSGSGTFTKAGAGNLTLNASTTLTGGTVLSLGTITLGASQSIGTGVLAISGGSTLAMGANNATVAGLTMNNAANVISGGGTLTVNGDAVVSRGSIAPLLAGSMNLIKQTASQTVALGNAANSFTGYTHVQDGILSTTALADAGVASSLGAPTGDNATIRLGNTTTTGTLVYTGGATSTNRLIALTGSTGGGIIDNDGTGVLTLTGDVNGNDYGAKTFTLQGATTGFSNVFSGVINDGLGTVALTKAEAGTWVLTQAQRYTGINTITLGTLQVNTATGGLGNATAANTINLNGGTLSLRNDGAGSNGTIIYGSAANPAGYNVTHSASSTINVDNLTANTGNTVVLGPIIQGTTGARSLTITGGNGYILSVPSFGLSGSTGQTTTLIPTTASLVITGNVTNPMSGFTASNFDTLVLDGTSTGNAIDGVMSDAAGGSIAAGGTTRITKSNTSTWTLNGVNTYTGVTTISGGTLQVTQAMNGLGNSVTAAAITLSGGTLSVLNDGAGSNGTLIFGSTGNTSGYNVTVSGNSTINVDRLTANTGNTVQLNNLTLGANTLTVTGANGYNLSFVGTGTAVTGSGTLNPTTATLTVGPVALSAGATFTLSGATNGNSVGAITSTTGALTKTGTSTWTLNAANTYTGVTSINQGTLVSAVDQNMTGGLNFGSASSITTAGTLDLTNTNATFGGAMLVQTNTATASTVTIGTGKALTINNTATFGSTTGSSTTQFSATGAGAFNVTNATVGNGFWVGNTTSSNVTTADFSGLETMNVSLATTGGVLLVGNTSGTNSTGYANLILANTSTITAGAITVGGGGSFNGNVGQVNSLKLGLGLNTIKADTFNIGTGSRDLGSVTFNDAVNGSVIIRAADGTGRAAFNMGTGGATTGVALNGNQNTFDVSGHNADLLFSTMILGNQNRAADLANVFSFDQGTLNAQSLTMATKLGNGFNTTSIMNLGGGTVTIGTGAGTAVTLASNSGPGTAVATLNITGAAAVTITGDVVRGANTGAGTSTGTVTLNGGSLDMSGFSMGSSTSLLVLNLQSGTLSNLAQFNGGAALNKTTAGMLNLGGTNSFTGPLNVQEGRVVLLGGANNRLSTTTVVTLGSGVTSGVLQLGSAAGGSNQELASLLISGVGTGNAVVGGSSALSTLTLNNASALTFTGNVGGTTGNDGNLNLVKTGAGVLTLSGVNRLNGGVTVSQGVLNAGFGTNGASSINVAGGAALNLTSLSAETLTLGSSGTVLTLGAGSTLGFEIGSVADQIIGGGLGSSALVTGVVNIDLFSLPGLADGTYTLIQMLGGGLLNTNGSSGSFVINSAPGGFQFNLNATDTLLQLVVSSVSIPTMYWRNGLGDNSWSSLSGGNTNWTTDLDGTVNAHGTPSAATDVIFSATTAPLNGTAINTTLDGSFTMKTLSFTSAPAGVTTVEVQTGTPNTSTLTFTPVDPATGVDVADNAGAVTIFSSVILGANQTWSVAGTGANGSSLTVPGNVSGSGFSLTKAGAGTLILGGTNSYGATTIAGGVLQIGNGGTTGTLGSGAVLNNGSLVFNHGAGANILLGNVISGTGGITKTGAGTVTLSSTTSSYTGKTIINGGTLKIASEASLGADPATATADQLTLSGGGALGMTADLTIDDANRGITLGAGGGVFSPDAGVTATVNKSITGAGSLGKIGDGTLVMGAANTFTGGVMIDAGTLKAGVSQTLTGGLTFGLVNGSGNAGTLDLSTASATFSGGIIVQSNNVTPHTVNIGSGQTLSLGGNVVIGVATPVVTNANARLTMNGGGALNVATAAGGLFQVGASSSGTFSQSSILDLSGLASVTINVSATGTVRVNQPNGTNLAGNQSALLLPTPTVGILPTTPVTTITAANFNVGDNGGNGGAAGQVNSVVFGTGLTTLNVNTVNIGTGGRDFGTLSFATANGTLRLRAANGTGRAAFNVGTGTANTGVGAGTGVTNNINLAGHSVDLLISTLTMGSQNRNTARTDTFTFDTGVLDATGVIIGTNQGTANTTAASSTWTSTLNLGGGSAIIGTGGMDLGIGALAVTGTDVINATVNISGGTVTVANNTTLGAAIRMGHNNVVTGLTANGTVNLTGTGSLTVSGNIIRGSTTGAGSATVTLNGAGAVLDLGGDGTARSIGSATNLVTFNLQQGTLRNLGEFNGGAALVKTGTGTVILDNTGGMTNTYTGVTTISGGTLQVGSGGSTGTLGGGSVTNNATLAFNRSDVHTVTNVVSGTGAVTQVGSGTTVLGVANSYTGTTTVSAGTLLVGTNAVTTATSGVGDVSVANGGTLGGTGTISALGKTSTILGGGVLSPGDSTAVGADTLGRLNIAGNLTTVTGGSADGQIQLGIFNPTLSDTTFAAALEASGNTLTALEYFNGASASVQNAWNAAQAVGDHNHDFLSISGSLTLTHGASGLPTIGVTSNGYINHQIGDVFNLLDWSTALATKDSTSMGAFTPSSILDLLLPALNNGYVWDTSLFASTGIIVVVPEPSRVMLFFTCLLGLALRRRRK